jgi:hypothetical protein
MHQENSDLACRHCDESTISCIWLCCTGRPCLANVKISNYNARSRPVNGPATLLSLHAISPPAAMMLQSVSAADLLQMPALPQRRSALSDRQRQPALLHVHLPLPQLPPQCVCWTPPTSEEVNLNHKSDPVGVTCHLCTYNPCAHFCTTITIFQKSFVLMLQIRLSSWLACSNTWQC